MFELLKSYFVDSTRSVLVTFLATLLGAKLILKLVRRGKSPPGPYGLPLLGYLPYFGTHPHITFTKLREKYGDIYSVQMGSFPAIIINGKELLKETFVNRGDDFSGRPKFEINRIQGADKMSFGQFTANTIIHKKICYHVLYVFTNARKNPIEDIIYDETRTTLAEFSNMDGKPFSPRDMLYELVGSVVFQVCYGTNTNLREESDIFRTFLESTYEFSEFVGSKNPVNVMPWLRFFMPGKVAKFVSLDNKVTKIRETMVDECLKSYSTSHMRHLTDGLIAAAREAEADPNSEMTPNRIYSTLDDIIGAGFETVATALNWTILYLTAFPEVQRKVHAEIDDILGKRQPKLSDKSQMPYCMATIHESLRFANIAPLGLPHAAVKDTELCGYDIPEGTVIMQNWYSVSHDKELWGDPMTFRPDRYLDENGQLDRKVVDIFTPFAIGRRKCVGENLARMELFLMFTCIFQNCAFTKPSDVETMSLDSVFGLTLAPVPYTVCASMR